MHCMCDVIITVWVHVFAFCNVVILFLVQLLLYR